MPTVAQLSGTVELAYGTADIGRRLLPDTMLQDAKLSWKARGLAAWLATYRKGTQVTRETMIQAASDGETSLQSGLRELSRAGYLETLRVQDERGRMVGWRYVLHPAPGGRS